MAHPNKVTKEDLKRYKKKCKSVIFFISNLIEPHLLYLMKRLKEKKLGPKDEGNWRAEIIGSLNAIYSLDVEGSCARILSGVGSDKDVLNCESCEIKKIYKNLVKEYKTTLV